MPRRWPQPDHDESAEDHTVCPGQMRRDRPRRADSSGPEGAGRGNREPLPARSPVVSPLRLAIPVKYGYKNIKRIATIRYTNIRPADFWAEQGYDWYAGH